MGALLTLLLKVGASPAAEVPEAALAEARRRYQQKQTAQAWAQSSNAVRGPAVSRTVTEPRPEPPPKPRPEPPPERVHEPPPPEISRLLSERSAGKGVELKERMDEVNSLYDRRDYEAAISTAREILAESPGNVRMLRVVVSSACMMGDGNTAQEFLAQLPRRDQRQMRTRCNRFGTELAPPPPDR
jgi:hypothetical protein